MPQKYDRAFLCCVNKFDSIKRIVVNKPFSDDCHFSGLLETALDEPIKGTILERIVTPEEFSKAVVEKV